MQSNKQFVSNLRQLREMKETKDDLKRKTGHELESLREEDEDEKTQLLFGYDPRMSYD